MQWIDRGVHHTVHPIETEVKQTKGFMRRFRTERGDEGQAWYKPFALCELQIIVPGANGLHHGKQWDAPTLVWEEAQAVIEQFELEQACPKHQVRFQKDGLYVCRHCGQIREEKKGGRIDG